MNKSILIVNVSNLCLLFVCFTCPFREASKKTCSTFSAFNSCLFPPFSSTCFKRITQSIQNETFFSVPQYPLGDSCRVYRPERESANGLSPSPSVFEKLDFEKSCKFSTLNIFCVETIIFIWLLLASNYSLNPPEYNDLSYYCIMKI